MNQGGVLTLAKGRLTADSARGWRGYNGLRLADCNIVPASGGVSGTLSRTTSGILFFDDFIRSNRALTGDNGWVDDAGTWSIVSNQATSSGGNFDRCRNTGMTASNATAVYEARAKAVSGTNYHMMRMLASSSSADYHIDMAGNNTDKQLAQNASSDTRLSGNITGTMDSTSFHVIKALYVPTRKWVLWFDHVLALGSIGTPFDVNSGGGPTAAGVIGMMGHGGAPLFDWVLVSSDHIISMTGLSSGYGFRLLNGSNTVLGSSGAETAGTATLDIATLVDGLTDGYIQAYSDQGTWASPISGARYPSSSTATDICGGDVYHLA